MRPHSSEYLTLENNCTDWEKVSRPWRWVAVIAPWCITAGYVVLQPAFEEDSKIRFSSTAMLAIAIALIAIGHGLSGVLCIACPNWLFLIECVLLPCLASCTLGVFMALYSFVVTFRFRWNSSATISVSVAGSTAAAYIFLVFFMRHRLIHICNRPSRTVNRTNQIPSPYEAPNNDLSPYQSLARTAQIKEHPKVFPSELSPETIESQEDMTRQQMLSLLQKNERDHRRTANTETTFKISLPSNSLRQVTKGDGSLPPLPGHNQTNGSRNAHLIPPSEEWDEGDDSDSTLQQQGIKVRRLRRVSREEREERRVEIELGRLHHTSA